MSRPDVDAMAAEVVLLMKTALAERDTIIASLTARMAAYEARPLAVDGKDGQPGEKGLDGLMGPAGPAGPEGPAGPARDGKDGLPGEKGMDGLIGPAGPEGPPGPARDGRDGLPGVPGLPGEKGLDGLNGKDGSDGLGFDDFEELFDGERTFTHRYTQGDKVKEFVWKTSAEIYRGVYVDGKTYERGDGATWGGSEWHCNETTNTKPGEGSKAWTLKVKRGRDGKDGRDLDGGLPVVTVGRR